MEESEEDAYYEYGCPSVEDASQTGCDYASEEDFFADCGAYGDDVEEEADVDFIA